MERARKAIELVLEAQKPYPAFALDRHWTIAASNGALPQLYDGVAGELLQPPVNALRLGLHPEGLARKIANFAEWRAHLLARLRRQIDLTGDTVLMELLEEVSRYPGGVSKTPSPPGAAQHAVVVPLRLQIAAGVLSFFSTTTIFGSPVDVTLSELALESFYPADESTAEIVRSLSAASAESVQGAHAVNSATRIAS
jgi:hypothetical protein